MIYLIICLLAYKHGQTNAFFYSRKGADALPRNEHVDLMHERMLWVAGILAGFLYGLFKVSFPVLCFEIAAGVLAFSFWHNGAYYVMRARIDLGITAQSFHDGWRGLYYAYWTRKSNTSTAKYDFSYRERLVMLYISFKFLLAGYTFSLWFPPLLRLFKAIANSYQNLFQYLW